MLQFYVICHIKYTIWEIRNITLEKNIPVTRSLFSNFQFRITSHLKTLYMKYKKLKQTEKYADRYGHEILHFENSQYRLDLR